MSDFIIEKDEPGWKFSRVLNKFPLLNYDTMYRTDSGLKSLEGFMGHNIKETDVDFKIDRKLTTEEIQSEIEYCRHDVQQTIEVFIKRKNDFDAQIGLICEFNLPLAMVNKTKTQLAAIILEARYRNYDDEFDISIPDTLRLSKYDYVRQWYLDKNNRSYDKQLKTDIAGVEHIFAWGGLHSAIPKYYGKGMFIMADVESLYPSLIIQYGYMSRSVPSVDKYIDIYNTRLALKHAGKKKENLPYKSVLNSTYGAMKDKTNALYDPRQANNICVAGQLLLLDLIEKLELSGCCQLIQSNTDGILVKLNKESDFDKVDDICYEWETRTRLKLEFNIYNKCFQKDVNNYVLITHDQKVKSKGSYVKEQSSLDYDLPIVNKAITDYMVNNTPVEHTVNSGTQLIDFQKIIKVSGKYKHACLAFNRDLPSNKKVCKYSKDIDDEYIWCNKFNRQCSYKQPSRAKCFELIDSHIVKQSGKPPVILNDKTFRVFASNNKEAGFIGKCKFEGATIEKFANTPDYCFIDNDNVLNKLTPNELDRQWYIDLAYERLRQFGVI